MKMPSSSAHQSEVVAPSIPSTSCGDRHMVAVTFFRAMLKWNPYQATCLRGLDGTAINWNGVANGTYNLLARSTTDFSTLRPGNFGADIALILEDGRSAYFQNGSPQLR